MAALTPHEAILDEIEARIRALDLGGTQNRVYRRLGLGDAARTDLHYPCVVVSPDGTESSLGGSTAMEHYGYPVSIRLLNRHPIEDPDFAPQLLLWRKRIRDELQHQPVVIGTLGDRMLTEGAVETLVPGEAYQALLQPSRVVEREAEAYQLFSSPLLFQVQVREGRPR